MARRQAVHGQRREVHLGQAARQSEGRLPQEPARDLVPQRQGGHGQRRLRGDVRPDAAAARVPRRCWRRAIRRSIPATSPRRSMRTKPIGTGPFKFVEFKQNEFIKLVKNPDYWKKGLPYLDAIEWRIIPNRSTRILAFVAGEFDMTFSHGCHDSADQGREGAGAQGDLRAGGPVCQPQPDRQPRSRAAFNNPKMRQAMALSLDRKRLHRHPGGGQGRHRRDHAAGAGRRSGACRKEVLEKMTGYGPNVEKNRRKPARSWKGSATARPSR